MLADAAAPVLVTQAALQARLPAYGGASVRLDADWPAIARQPARAPDLALDPHHPAYVIYTSGSTGSPKGVVVDARGIANLAAAQIGTWGLRRRARVLQFDFAQLRRCRLADVAALGGGALLVLTGNVRDGDALAG